MKLERSSKMQGNWGHSIPTAVAVLVCALLAPTTGSALSWSALASWLSGEGPESDPAGPAAEGNAGDAAISAAPEPDKDWGIVPEPFVIAFADADLRTRFATIGIRMLPSGMGRVFEVDLECLETAFAAAAGVSKKSQGGVRAVRFLAKNGKIEVTLSYRMPPKGQIKTVTVQLELTGSCVKELLPDGPNAIAGAPEPEAPGDSPWGIACSDAVLDLSEPMPPVGNWLVGDLDAGKFVLDEAGGATLPPDVGCSPMCPDDWSAPCETFWCE